MKKLLALFLALILCVLSLFGCSQTQSSDDSDDGDRDSADSSLDFFGDDNGSSSNGSSDYPRDILEGLPYTISCIDKYTLEPVDYNFTDNGRLNDGKYRSETDLENETGDDMRVTFEGTSSYNFVITFESDGTYDAYRLVAHNCDFSFSFLKIEVGRDIDDLTELEFEDDFDTTINMHADNYAEFDFTNINIFRITITTGTSSTTAFDELSLLGYPKGEAVNPESSTPESSTPDEGDIDSLLIGTWGADDPEIVEKGGDDYKVILTFGSDGSGIYLQAGVELPFTWYTKNDVLYMKVTLVGDLVKPYSLSNGVLYLDDEDGRTTEFVKIQ